MKKLISMIITFAAALGMMVQAMPLANTVQAADLSYADLLFDNSYVHEINIDISETDWADLLKNPTQKTKYMVDITIDGETIQSVSFSTKGNSSLSTLASSSSSKYGFKVSFGKFVDGQKYHGLNKFSLANCYIDATNMKDYLSYEIFNAAGVDAPLTSYCMLSINGEPFSLYLVIEDESKSYMKRTGHSDGVMYKPETEGGGFNMGGGGGNRGGNGTASGSSSKDSIFLKYIDDNISSYPRIFEDTVTDATEEDEQRLIAALKAISEGNVEAAVNTDEVIRYFAAHNFVVNLDSYTGDIGHNYYLLEENGILSMLPWDYNEAFGAHGLSGNQSAPSIINSGIDSLLGSASDADRPMWNWIVTNEEYLEKYHEIYAELIENYFDSGACEEEINRIHDLIRPYVEEDPNAFYSAEKFDTACESLKLFCKLRAESVKKQLEGGLATVTKEQNKADYVDTTGLDLVSMGIQNGR